jgi:hypothetical protein
LANTKLSRLGLGIAVVAVVAVLVFWRCESASRGKGMEKGGASAAVESPAAPAPKLAQPTSPPPPVAVPSTSTTATATASPDARPPSPAGHLVESSLMARLRSARAAGQHVLAIQLAREGNRRFPDSAFAPERHSILVHSLADNEQRNEARGEAELMVNHYPDSDWVREVERFTGAHRHRNVRLNDAGEIEYY